MASELKVDKFTGVTTAGSIDVVGEGNSTTTNLQQGLTKQFVAYQSSSSTVVLNSQSFNTSSLTDNGTGDTIFTLTNNMSQTRYVIPDSGGDDNAGYSTWCVDGNMTTALYRYTTGDANFSTQDTAFHSCSAIGDLA